MRSILTHTNIRNGAHGIDDGTRASGPNHMRLVVLLTWMTAAVLLAQAPVPVEQEPQHHPVFDNGRVRVLDVRLPPGYVSLFHVHALDNVSVRMTAGTMRTDLLTGDGLPQTSPAGRVAYYSAAPPYTHRVVNAGSDPVRILDVELPGVSGPSSASGAPAETADVPAGHALVVGNDHVRVLRVVVGAGRHACGAHPPARLARGRGGRRRRRTFRLARRRHARAGDEPRTRPRISSRFSRTSERAVSRGDEPMTRIGVLGTVLACLAGGMMTITMAAQTTGVETLPDGVRIATGGGFLSLHVKTDAIVRVTFSKTREFRADTMVVAGPGAGGDARLNPFTSAPETAAVVPVPKWSRTSNAATVTLTTTKLVVTVNRQDGAVRFADRSGHTVLAEVPGAHTLAPANVQGENTFHVQQRWQADANESLYGLGERQEGKLDIKGYDFDLWQRNTFVAMPVVMSSRGYGILWDNTSYTKFGDTRPFEPIPAADLVDANGIAGGLSTGALATADGPLQDAATTATLGVGRDAVVVAGPSSAAASNAEAANAGAPAPARGRGNVARGGGAGRGAQPAIRAWQGEIVAPVTGDYQFQTYSNGLIQVWLDGALQIDHYKQTWATENDQFKVHLDAGRRYPIKIQLSSRRQRRCASRWKTPDRRRRHVALVGGRRRHRLLLRLRPGARRRRRRLSAR